MFILEILKDGTEDVWVNIVPYIAREGVKWQRADIDGSDAGRDLSGDLHRNRVSTKTRLDITCRLLTDAENQTILTLLEPEYITVRYTAPNTGSVVEKTMYSNNISVSYALTRFDGSSMWAVSFPLIER